MSLDKTLQAFTAHLHNLVDESVFLGRPSGGNTGIHIYVYWVGGDPALNTTQGNDLEQRFNCLIFSNPESSYAVIDKVMHAFHQHPMFKVEGVNNVITRIQLSPLEISQLYLALNQPYRLSLAYEVRYVVKESEVLVPVAPVT